jgi:glycosyltransferase involved in cell wall biosynthesis
MSDPVRVSVITPTYNRERFLPHLIACFQSQTATGLELLILDDSTEPSRHATAAARQDPRIRYVHSSRRLSIGEKRNRLVRESRGSVIVQFDDDDYYSPLYVERMLQHLGEGDLVKLGAWFGYSAATRRFFYWDTSSASALHFVVSPIHPLQLADLSGNDAAFTDRNLWGFGFSYVGRRRVFDSNPFDDIDGMEDYQFAKRAQAEGCSLRHVADGEGLALHVIHGSNTSISFPQYLIPEALARHLFGVGAERLLGLTAT